MANPLVCARPWAGKGKARTNRAASIRWHTDYHSIKNVQPKPMNLPLESHSVKIRASVLPFSAGAPGIFLSSSEPACPASSVANSSPSSTESFEQAFPLISSTSSRAAVLRGPAPLGIRQRFGFARPSEILMLRILKDFLALFRKKAYVLLLKLMLRGGGTFSPLRCRCRRSSWSMARYSCLSK